MTQRAIDILNRWVAETVRAVPQEEIGKEAERLATEFTAYAEDAGLNVQRLETDISEDLVSHMRDALLAAADSQADGVFADEQ